MELKEIKIKDIVNNKFDFFYEDKWFTGELFDSIKEIGLIVPIVVISVGEKYIVIDGQLRYDICKQLNQDTIQCIVTDIVTDKNKHKVIFGLAKLNKKVDAYKLAKYINKHGVKYSDATPGINIPKVGYDRYTELLEWNWSQYHTPEVLENKFLKKHKSLF